MTAKQTVHVQSRQEITERLQQASRDKTPLCVYRKSIPPNGIRLDLSGLNQLIEIDSDNLVATVEPGLKMGDLAEALTQKGLRFLPADAPYYRHLTVGEWVYQGCPNVSSWKYGPGKHTLMGSAYILPSGKYIRTGGKTVKNVTGYDFTRFLAGAYSDIGIGVEFLLKLLPQPEYRMDFSANFASLPHVFGFIDFLRENPIAPAFLMTADAAAQRLLLNKNNPAPFLAEFELDGVTQEVETFAKKIQDEAKKYQAALLTSDSAQDKKAALSLDTVFASQAAYKVCDEWKIPYDKQLITLETLEKEFSRTGWFGQWAEGKVHACFSTEEDSATTVPAITRHIRQAGGTSSSIYDRAQGKIPDGPLGALELALRNIIDPEGIFGIKEELA